MLNAIRLLHDKTKQLALKLEEAEFEEFVALVDERDRVLAFCKDQFENESQANKEVFKRELRSILSYDPAIVNRMQQLQEEAERGLSHLRKLKVQKSAYESQGSEHSMFFDKKK